MSEKVSGAESLVQIFIGAGNLFLEAWVILMMWGWFMAPLGARPITYWLAMGISTLVGLLTYAPGIKREENAIYQQTGAILFYWIVGALVHLGVRP